LEVEEIKHSSDKSEIQKLTLCGTRWGRRTKLAQMKEDERKVENRDRVGKWGSIIEYSSSKCKKK